jgi:hypothetical protein
MSVGALARFVDLVGAPRDSLVVNPMYEDADVHPPVSMFSQLSIV